MERRKFAMTQVAVRTELGNIGTGGDNEATAFKLKNVGHSEAIRDLEAYYHGTANDLLLKSGGEKDTSEGEKLRDDGARLYNGLASEDSYNLNRAFKNVLGAINDTDLNEFYYEDDTDFVHQYRDKYEKLKAFSHGLEFLDEMDKDATMDHAGLDIFKARAKSEMISEILRDYEARMRIIQSPFYALLSGKDFAHMSVKKIEELKDNTNDNVNPGLKDYLDAVIVMKQSKSYKKSDCTGSDSIDSVLEDKIKRIIKDDAKAGRKKLKDTDKMLHDSAGELDIKKLENQSQYDEALKNIIEKQSKTNCPDLTRVTIKDNIPVIGTGLASMFEADFVEMNKHTMDMLEHPDAYHLSNEDRTILGGYVNELLEAQTKINRVSDKSCQVLGMQNAWNDDNPEYSAKEKATLRIYEKMIGDLDNEVKRELSQARDRYNKIQQDILKFRCERGIFMKDQNEAWRRCHEAAENVQPKGTAKIGNQTIPLFSISGLDRFHGKELELAEKVEMEDFLAVVEDMTEKVRHALGYSDYMSKNNGFISGILMWELSWRGDNQWIPDALDAVSKFKGMCKVKA